MILVTGGTGLVGSHLLYDLVKSGEHVRALRRESSNLQNVLRTFEYYSPNAQELFSKIEWVYGNILDFYSLTDALDDVKKVYHAAAFVSFSPSDKYRMLKNNIEGTANIVNASLEQKIEKLCYISSTAALGTSYSGKLVDENVLWSPSKKNSTYSVSKFNSEVEVWRGIAEGLKAVILNPSIIFGPGNWERGSAKMFTTIWKGMNFYTLGVTGFVDVRDVTRAMTELMNNDISSERFIISSENLSYKEVFENIADALGKKRPDIYANTFLSEIAWRGDWLRNKVLGTSRVITKETISAGRNKVYFSNKKIKETIGIEFIPIEKTIKETAKLFLEDFETK